jgi:hypothetical protein
MTTERLDSIDARLDAEVQGSDPCIPTPFKPSHTEALSRRTTPHSQTFSPRTTCTIGAHGIGLPEPSNLRKNLAYALMHPLTIALSGLRGYTSWIRPHPRRAECPAS